MTTRKQRHARKVQGQLDRDPDRAERLTREIYEIFEELNGYGNYEEACFERYVKYRENARASMAELRSRPALYREFRKRQNEWRQARPPEAKARDKRLKAAWAKANATRLNERRKARDVCLKADRPDAYRARARARSERARARPQHKAQARAASKRHFERLKQDPERYERKKAADRKKKARWYERNAERAREAERARRRGPAGDQVRARDRERYHARRDEERGAAKARRDARSEEARNKQREQQREWYLRNRARVLARAKASQSSPERRAAKQEYDRARYVAGIGRKAA